MGEIVIPQKAQFFCGVLYTEYFNLEAITDILEKNFGSIILRSQPFQFTETHYYEPEMGETIFRIFLGFDLLIGMDEIVQIKYVCNDLENQKFSKEGKRKVNIDPGYCTLAKVVLPTTKNFQHRVYLRRGIYAEVTLRWRRGSFSPWEWTFKDYCRDESIKFFNNLREIYRVRIRGNGG